MTQHIVLVPIDGSRPSQVIARGSGVVCERTAWEAGGKVKAYYEGNLYGSENMVRFEDRVLHASGRLARHYPTVAFGVWDSSDFVAAGTFDFSDDFKQRHLEITDVFALARWSL